MEQFLDKVSKYLKSEDFREHLKLHSSILPEGHGEAFRSLNEKHVNQELNINLLKLSYLRILFLTLVSHYATNQEVLEKEKGSERFKGVSLLYDQVITMLFTHIFDLKLPPAYNIYLLGFCINFEKVKENLLFLSSRYADDNNFQNMVKEIDKHFEEKTQELNSNIAMKSNIYDIVVYLIKFRISELIL